MGTQAEAAAYEDGRAAGGLDALATLLATPGVREAVLRSIPDDWAYSCLDAPGGDNPTLGAFAHAYIWDGLTTAWRAQDQAQDQQREKREAAWTARGSLGFTLDGSEFAERSMTEIAEGFLRKEGVHGKVLNIEDDGTDGGYWCFVAQVAYDPADQEKAEEAGIRSESE